MTPRPQAFIPILLSALLCACAIDYSPIQFAPAGTTRAYVTSGIVGASNGAVYIEAVNDVSISQPVPGREAIVPAGKVRLKLRYFRANIYNTETLTHEFSPDRYYVINGNPDFKNMKISYEVSEVSSVAFREFQCETQRKAQRNIGAINPQKAPACDAPPDPLTLHSSGTR